jgi:hypothetical protein
MHVKIVKNSENPCGTTIKLDGVDISESIVNYFLEETAGEMIPRLNLVLKPASMDISLAAEFLNLTVKRLDAERAALKLKQAIHTKLKTGNHVKITYLQQKDDKGECRVSRGQIVCEIPANAKPDQMVLDMIYEDDIPIAARLPLSQIRYVVKMHYSDDCTTIYEYYSTFFLQVDLIPETYSSRFFDRLEWPKKQICINSPIQASNAEAIVASIKEKMSESIEKRGQSET